MDTKDTNPKDAVGIRRWRQRTTVPYTVIWELGVAMLEGARKYGRHNYRVAGVRASVYIDAADGHIGQFWEGEDVDPDSGLSHVTKAIASLTVLRDAMINGTWVDDRPPAVDLDAFRRDTQAVVDRIFDDIPEPKEPFTQANSTQTGDADSLVNDWRALKRSWAVVTDHPPTRPFGTPEGHEYLGDDGK